MFCLTKEGLLDSINFPAHLLELHLLGIAIDQNNDRSASHHIKINEENYELFLRNRFHVDSVVE